MKWTFVNQLNDKLKNNYRNLDIEKAHLQGIEAEQIIEMTINFLVNLYKDFKS